MVPCHWGGCGTGSLHQVVHHRAPLVAVVPGKTSDGGSARIGAAVLPFFHSTVGCSVRRNAKSQKPRGAPAEGLGEIEPASELL